MKKLLLAIMALLTSVAIQAKVIKITLSDGSQQVYTSSQLSAIDFNEDGTLTLTTYDGQVLPPIVADYDAVEISDEAVVYETFNDTLSFNIDADGVPVDLHATRPITKINYVYPSKDPFGEPVTLSGTILIPDEIWNGIASCEGILMVNHYTKFHRNEAPTLSNGELESMLLANPLNPKYIIVESDFYGFGVTVRFPQAFMQGLVNARSSLYEVNQLCFYSRTSFSCPFLTISILVTTPFIGSSLKPGTTTFTSVPICFFKVSLYSLIIFSTFDLSVFS